MDCSDELVKRLVHRMMQFRADRVKAMIEEKSHEGDGPPELNRFAEACALIAIVQAFKPVPDDIEDLHGSEDGYMRVLGLTAGHVLTDADVAAIEKVLADDNDAREEATDAFHKGRKAALHEVGGAELVAAAEAKDEALVKQMTNNALAHFRAETTKHRAGTPHKLDTLKQVFFYEQEFYFLSNFSAFTLEWKGFRFDTSEAAYHWEKFAHLNEVGIVGGHECITCYDIRRAASAHEAFKLAEANAYARRPDWDDVKVDIMREILRAKVNQHGYGRRKLMQTGDRELIEDSWRDGFWGWGEDYCGQNMLGKLWMEIRAELRAGADAATHEVAS